ncbi:MAG: phosphopentomutase [Mycoplasmataceae bacterium]|nr:phosphopentomutase [Mycoplasmataceae bacterium]
MGKFKRVIMIVTDSLGIGEDERAKEFGDEGANTLLHVSDTGLLDIPNWREFGIDKITKVAGDKLDKKQTAYMARIAGVSNAKDTLAGHWEMMGIRTVVPYPVFTETGFPKEMLDALSKLFDGRKIVGNKAASGTTILEELADKERDENAIIVYTSGDSVLQICGHEEWMGVEKLWEYGEKARELCNSKPEWNVGRIIVRPYIGKEGSFERTHNRHDYAVHPPKRLVLNDLKDSGVDVVSVGKINDIFGGEGISRKFKSNGDEDGMNITIDLAKKSKENTFIFTNLVDFDAKYGHRRKPEGYAQNINLFDKKLGELKKVMNEDDLLIITSDHGNDPTFPGSDHTREHVPATIFSKSFKEPKNLENFKGMGTLGNIVARNFGVPLCETGEDVYDKLK